MAARQSGGGRQQRTKEARLSGPVHLQGRNASGGAGAQPRLAGDASGPSRERRPHPRSPSGPTDAAASAATAASGGTAAAEQERAPRQGQAEQRRSTGLRASDGSCRPRRNRARRPPARPERPRGRHQARHPARPHRGPAVCVLALRLRVSQADPPPAIDTERAKPVCGVRWRAERARERGRARPARGAATQR